MARYTASPVAGLGGYDIAEVDADGIGRRHLYVTYDQTSGPAAAEAAARFLVLGLSLEGGLLRAIEVLRAEHVRQQS